MSASCGVVVDALLQRFPKAWADPWDRIGLIAGDPQAAASRIMITLDLDRAALDAAIKANVDLIITHHPPFLDPPADLVIRSGGSARALEAVRSGIAVAAFHSNLDRSPAGRRALPERLGLDVAAPLERGAQEVDVVVTYVPPESAADVIAEMSSAGAGRIGEYSGCVFQGEGTGSFFAGEGTDPAVGTAGEATKTDEVRVEMVAPRGGGQRVSDACRDAHPYEEPVILVVPATLARGAARLGALCATGGASLGELADKTATSLGVCPRIWGEADTSADSVAVVGGSASSMVEAAIAAGAQTLVCGEVRYHVAQDALDRGLGIIEVGHDASEWPLVPVLADSLRSLEEAAGIEVIVEEARVRWDTWLGSGHERA